MIALLQRVRYAKVEVAGEVVGQIDGGTLALIGVQPDDTPAKADKLLHKILGYRMFSDPDGKMNLSLRDTQGGLLLVSQFTLAADTKSGMRAGFSTAAPPALANELFDYIVKAARENHPIVETGQFAADMQVSLQNDGPVTFWLEV